MLGLGELGFDLLLGGAGSHVRVLRILPLPPFAVVPPLLVRIKSPFSVPGFALALAGIRRLVVRIKAIEKGDLMRLVTPALRGGTSASALTECLLISFRKSTPPQNRQLVVY